MSTPISRRLLAAPAALLLAAGLLAACGDNDSATAGSATAVHRIRKPYPHLFKYF